MASKLNRKFIFVVGGFSLAAVLLLVAVILVNQLWLNWRFCAAGFCQSGTTRAAAARLRLSMLVWTDAVFETLTITRQAGVTLPVKLSS